MTSERVEVITSVERRRRWSRAEKERLVAASLEPGASVSLIAREAGIHPSQLYGWRRQMRGCVRQEVGFAPVEIAGEIGPAGLTGLGAIDMRVSRARCGGWRYSPAWSILRWLTAISVAALTRYARRRHAWRSQ